MAETQVTFNKSVADEFTRKLNTQNTTLKGKINDINSLMAKVKNKYSGSKTADDLQTTAKSLLNKYEEFEKIINSCIKAMNEAVTSYQDVANKLNQVL